MNAPHAVTLRPALAHEAPVLARMSRDLVEAGTGWRYTPLRMKTLIAAADTTTLVACDPRFGLHGFAVMTFGDDDAHLALLAVLPASQRQGLATRLLDWLFASARVAGTPLVKLELRADNPGAFAFYRRIGFAETGRLPGYYGGRVDARRMELTLR